jgi:hypothetical protein
LSSNFALFKKQLANSFAFRMFLFTKVPAAFFAGIKLEKLEMEEAAIGVSYKWFNTNPFRSVYFAVLLMAGEISTGILCMAHLYKIKPGVSMLLIQNESNFYKKATGKITFTCTDGTLINEAADKAIATGEATTVRCRSIGKNEQQETVTETYFTWSFKIRKKA